MYTLIYIALQGIPFLFKRRLHYDKAFLEWELTTMK